MIINDKDKEKLFHVSVLVKALENFCKEGNFIYISHFMYIDSLKCFTQKSKEKNEINIKIDH